MNALDPLTRRKQCKNERWDYGDPVCADGVAEDFPLDQSTDSLFGALKVVEDVMAQEEGRYSGLPAGASRGGCLGATFEEISDSSADPAAGDDGVGGGKA